MKKKIHRDDCDSCGARAIPVVLEDLGPDVPLFAACKACDQQGFQAARDADTELWLAGGTLPPR